MKTNHTNLLSPEGVRRIRQGYLLRLLTVALLLGTLVIGIHALLLIPAHLHAAAEVRTRSAERSALAQQTQSPEERAAQQRIAALQEDIVALRTLGDMPTTSTALSSVLAVERFGIAVQGIAYTAPVSATSTGRMVLSGTAATRESLRTFVGNLETVPGVDEVELPISAYAKESNIPFTITLSGPFTI